MALFVPVADALVLVAADIWTPSPPFGADEVEVCWPAASGESCVAPVSCPAAAAADFVRPLLTSPIAADVTAAPPAGVGALKGVPASIATATGCGTAPGAFAAVADVVVSAAAVLLSSSLFLSPDDCFAEPSAAAGWIWLESEGWAMPFGAAEFGGESEFAGPFPEVFVLLASGGLALLGVLAAVVLAFADGGLLWLAGEVAAGADSLLSFAVACDLGASLDTLSDIQFCDGPLAETGAAAGAAFSGWKAAASSKSANG